MSTLLSRVTAGVEFVGSLLDLVLRHPAALRHLDSGCEFVGIRVPLSADLKHAMPRRVSLGGAGVWLS